LGRRRKLADFQQALSAATHRQHQHLHSGITSIVVDNEKGLHDAISHLIEVHGRRRIAFIRGPEMAQDAEIRYGVYQKTLAEHGLPLDLDLVFPTRNFSAISGQLVTRVLLDERKVSFDAVVAAND